MRVLGIDCGTEYTGYGVVDLLPDDRLVCIVCGAIKVSPRDPMPTRLSRISRALAGLASMRIVSVSASGSSAPRGINVE